MPDIASTAGFLAHLGQALAGLIIILDPLGLLPLIIALTRQLTDKERNRVITQVTFAGLVMLLFFAAAGTGVLAIFSISLDDMRIAGGILLLVIALKIVLDGHLSMASPASLGIVPLASPLLVGPGAIAASIVQVRIYGLATTLTAVVLSFMICLIIFRFTAVIYRILGESGSDVVARIMGILLAAIAVSYIRTGVIGFVVGQ